MQFIKVRSLLLAVMIGMVAALISLGVLGMMAPALAQGPELEVDVPAAQVSSPVDFTIFFTDPVAILPIFDLTGDEVGKGTHEGKLRCKNKCSQKTHIQLNDIEYQYQARTREGVDLGARQVVVGGTGTIKSNGRKESFSFTAAFQDKGDGTIEATYNASRKDASFFVRSPGTLTFSGE